MRIAGICAFVAACSSDSTISAFSSDGCSLFPDRSAISAADWCSCCFEHDVAYWRGGTAEQRQAADVALRECIIGRTGNQTLASMMYEGVRIGGSPWFYNWYRWGYGWSYDRKYQALSPSETALADDIFAEYRASEPTPVCAAD